VGVDLVDESLADGTSYRWTNAGSFPSEGNISDVLFPGQYSIEFTLPAGAHGAVTLTAVTPFLGAFDRSTSLIAGPGLSTVDAGGFFAWTIPGKLGPSTYLDIPISSNACDYVLAALNSSAFGQFQSDHSVIEASTTTEIHTGSTTACTDSNPVSSVGSPITGPFTFSSGEALVFYNSGPENSTLDISGQFLVSSPTS
jgi:hypothetical protein